MGRGWKKWDYGEDAAEALNHVLSAASHTLSGGQSWGLGLGGDSGNRAERVKPSKKRFFVLEAEWLLFLLVSTSKGDMREAWSLGTAVSGVAEPKGLLRSLGDAYHCRVASHLHFVPRSIWLRRLNLACSGAHSREKGGEIGAGPVDCGLEFAKWLLPLEREFAYQFTLVPTTHSCLPNAETVRCH